ncbi:HD-GYP domain-containing protein [Paenibacillus allorhizosphaerae]|uniref:HD-GYP domain-containing protein n=1 Tax=Paenibacillus allorhizosphaerae TaxID=2849866 RepID=A0ABN7TI67_9BACL|nr:HD-GYP domain-containing protein [Paenibacillus allorhizosphaerae]CAG7631279.1 hypothetical protein PAECIP111802_01728 [Paenibacillus allorhizosphaerae]
MRLLSLSMVRPGMRLAKKIYNEDGLTLLSEHVELSQSLINRLGCHGIDFVYIDDPRTRDIVVTDPISDETRVRAISDIRGSFRKIMEDQTKRRSVGSVKVGKVFGDMMKMILDDLGGNKDAMIMLSNISLMDTYLFQHSLNVCIYASMLGMAYGYSRDELLALGLGALLHDVGKTQIPLELLKKKDQLTEEEFVRIKKHADFGFQFLKDEPNIPLLSAHCALQHHERIDGSGYPRGLKGNEIHDYAQWIGLVDSYDAMTTHRVYRKAMLPHQAMDILYSGSGTLYEQSKIRLFRDRVAIYPVGVTVKLNTGETGVVVDLNSNAPQRPVVRILQDADGRELSNPTDEIDLSKHLSVMITGVNELAV